VIGYLAEAHDPAIMLSSGTAIALPPGMSAAEFPVSAVVKVATMEQDVRIVAEQIDRVHGEGNGEGMEPAEVSVEIDDVACRVAIDGLPPLAPHGSFRPRSSRRRRTSIRTGVRSAACDAARRTRAIWAGILRDIRVVRGRDERSWRQWLGRAPLV
jgi:hypothetical protein